MIYPFLEADEQDERIVIENDFYQATEVITSYIIQGLLWPLLSVKESAGREELEVKEMNNYSFLVSSFNDSIAVAIDVFPVVVNGWEKTRLQISQREHNCFMELRRLYRESSALTSTIIYPERQARKLLDTFWHRGIGVLYSKFAQDVKCLQLLEALTEFSVQAASFSSKS
jgi:hypothetical protein